MKRNRSRNWRRGISLPEVLTTSFSFALLLAGLVLLTINTGTGWSFGTSKMTADNSASLAMQAWAKDVRNGRTASTSSNGTVLTVNFPVANAQGDYDRNSSTATTAVTYSLSSGKLVRTQGTATTTLGKKLTSVLFSVAGSEVTLQLTAQQKNGTKTGTTTLTSQVYLRNEPPQ